MVTTYVAERRDGGRELYRNGECGLSPMPDHVRRIAPL